jgi:hypothetical protein
VHTFCVTSLDGVHTFCVTSLEIKTLGRRLSLKEVTYTPEGRKEEIMEVDVLLQSHTAFTNKSDSLVTCEDCNAGIGQ